MSQVIPLRICQIRDTNENEVEQTVKIIEKKKAKILLHSNVLKTEVGNWQHENFLLDKQISCTESFSQNLEQEISELKTKTVEAACSLESTQWNMYRTNILKEFEDQRNKDTGKQMFKNDKFVKHGTSADIAYHNDPQSYVYSLQNNSNDDNSLKMLREKVKELRQEVEKKKEALEKTDSSLHMDIKILEKRNAALIVRYQRQLEETESRYRQTLTELNSLQKLLAEKNALLIGLNDK